MRRIEAASVLLPVMLLAACGSGGSGNASQGVSGNEVAANASSAGAVTEAGIDRLDPALDAIIAPGTKPEKVADGFKLVEGPVWVDGKLRFSDLDGNKLYEIGDDGQAHMVLDHSGGLDDVPAGMAHPGSNGEVVYTGDTVLMCQHGLRRIVQMDSHYKMKPFLTEVNGKKFNSPNDLIFAPDGSLWITDPPYGLAGQDKDPAKEQPYNAVYRYANGKIKAVITDLPRPNGIGFSPDGKKLYVSNSEPDMFVNVYDVNADGTVSNPKKLISYPGPVPVDVPDGLKVDSQGNIWTSGPGGIRIISPQGKVLGQIKTPTASQNNLAWGGPDRKTAYIMAANAVYKLQIKIPGEKPLYPKS